jgi:hypothetical protein
MFAELLLCVALEEDARDLRAIDSRTTPSTRQSAATQLA